MAAPRIIIIFENIEILKGLQAVLQYLAHLVVGTVHVDKHFRDKLV
jgi:hypothetical protein